MGLRCLHKQSNMTLLRYLVYVFGPRRRRANSFRKLQLHIAESLLTHYLRTYNAKL